MSVFALVSGSTMGSQAGRVLVDSPEAFLGARLFRETRFAQFFHARASGDVNGPLLSGDPIMDRVERTSGQALPARFPGQGINCRQCHLGDDFLPERRFFGRTYCDFVRRSAVPRRDDRVTTTTRNSPLTVGLTEPRDVAQLLHFDAEFVSLDDLVIGTLTGRNLGWLPSEGAQAIAHVASVIRFDDGRNELADYYSNGLPYSVVFGGVDRAITQRLRLPAQYRVDTKEASDDEIVRATARLMSAYMSSLRFGPQPTRSTDGSPYERFLQKNGLPIRPGEGQGYPAYAERLRKLIEQLRAPVWVTPRDGEFELHSQVFQFGPLELQGLQIFLRRAGTRNGRAGNCVACHPPPYFTDYRLHNTGVSQREYDTVFGEGEFAALPIPGIGIRSTRFDDYLPPSPHHPQASGRFRTPVSPEMPGYADLGVWNVFGNPDVPKPQAAIAEMICEEYGLARPACSPERVLPLTIAVFKTPTLRDLGQSEPYFHSGSADTIEDVLSFYARVSRMARAGALRNASPAVSHIQIDPTDVIPLAAFLRALNEDYR